MVHRKVGVLAYDGVTLLDVAGPVEVFNEANADQSRYSISLLGLSEGAVRTSSGVHLCVRKPTEEDFYDLLIVPGADGVPPMPRVLVEAVRQLSARSRRVASICTGSFLLAEAGLLDGRPATTHWRYADVLRRRYPAVAVNPDAIFLREGSVFTSAGVSAGIDLALALVEDDHGPQLARDVARSLVVVLRRPGGQSQFSARSELPALHSSPLRNVVDAISRDPAAEHTLTSLAHTAGMSTRHLTRLFQSELNTTPARFVEVSRIEAAQAHLLEGASVTAAAAASGFGSDETLRRAFLRHLHITPTSYRAGFTSTRHDRTAASPIND